MAIGTSKITMFGGAGGVPAGSQTFNASGTFNAPPGLSTVNLNARGGSGNPGAPGNPGNPGMGGSGGTIRLLLMEADLEGLDCTDLPLLPGIPEARVIMEPQHPH